LDIRIRIGHEIFLLACDDVYGYELDLASKLEEDVAEMNEAQLTSSARKIISDTT